jgi:undecaprenyl-diphosphatase
MRFTFKAFLLAVLIIGAGVVIEYVDETVLSVSTPTGPDVFPPWISHWDAYILLHINPSLVNPLFGMLFGLITHLGNALAGVALCLLLYAFGYRREALLALIAIVLGTIVELPLKMLIMRPRPHSTLSAVIPLENEAGPSFPSGHSITIFSLSTVLSNRRGKAALPLYALAATVAFSRIYLGVHYPLDVLVGSMIGWISGKLTLRCEPEIVGLASRFLSL